MLRLPLTVKHDDVTVQVPTALPPQGDTSGQDFAPPVPLLELPPAPFPPVPDEFELMVHAPEIIPNNIAVARAADCAFIEGPP